MELVTEHGIKALDTSGRVVVVGCLCVALCDTLSNAMGYSALLRGSLSTLGLPYDGKAIFEASLFCMSLVLSAVGRRIALRSRLYAWGSLGVLAAGVFLAFAAPLGLAPLGQVPVGIAVFGVGFFWYKLFVLYTVMLLHNAPAFLLCIACSKPLSIAVGTPLWVGGDAAQLIMVACCVVGCAVGATALMHYTVEEVATESHSGNTPDSSSGTLLAQAVLAAVVLASIQPFTLYGTYANSAFGDPRAYGLLLLATLGVPVVTMLVFVRHQPSSGSFRLAFLLILAAVFVASVQTGQDWALPPVVSAGLLTLFEMFAQVVFWAAVASACWRDPDHAIVIMGAAMAAFSAVSIFWITLLSHAEQWLSLAVTIVVYGLSLVSFRVFPYIAAVRKSEKAILSDNLLNDMAREHGLSPRETQVFLRLARGRSRSVIQEDLHISEGTVKTHTSRIYQKFNVDNKQALLSYVLEQIPRDET